ncbi:hypothetical protein [Rhodococcoides fascians]|uniref:hypothetical protein n=1 Tax=Rhodococcoides fascians TaxID=1828 RepID=UPI00055A7EEB|nr:hypothetical protein [Rhodococcus fascians]
MITWTLTTTVFGRRPALTAAGSELTRTDAAHAAANAARSALMDAASDVVAATGPVYRIALDEGVVLTIGTGGTSSGRLVLDDALDALETFEHHHP